MLRCYNSQIIYYQFILFKKISFFERNKVFFERVLTGIFLKRYKVYGSSTKVEEIWESTLNSTKNYMKKPEYIKQILSKYKEKFDDYFWKRLQMYTSSIYNNNNDTNKSI